MVYGDGPTFYTSVQEDEAEIRKPYTSTGANFTLERGYSK